MQKIVKLPCECANSVYHIACITQFLQSGENKNFCPHCKTIYELLVQEPDKHLRFILFFHILSNSLLNIINISTISDDYHNINANIISKILLICYFCKMLLNGCIILNYKKDPEKIEINLYLSYIIQTVLFILLVILIINIKNDFNSAILMANNVFFCFGDLAFRISIEHHWQMR